MSQSPCKDRISLFLSICIGTVIVGLRMRPFWPDLNGGMNSHVITNAPPPFFFSVFSPVAPHSFHNAQTIALSPPPVSQNLILLLVPSSQSAVRVCLTNSPLLLSLPFHPSVLPHPCSPQGLAKDLCSDEKRESIPHLCSRS